MAANVKRTREQGTVLVTNGGTDKAAGKAIVVGELVCVLKEAALANATNCPAWVDYVQVNYAKLTTDVVAIGATLYFDAGNDRLTLTASTHKKAGVAATAAGNGVTTVDVHLGLIR